MHNNAPLQKRPSFLLTLLVLLLCLSLGGAIGMLAAYLAHLFKPNDTLEATLMLLGIFGLGIPSFNFLSKKFPHKINFSRNAP